MEGYKVFHVTSLQLFVSVVNDHMQYKIVLPHYDLKGTVTDPVDFVMDMQSKIDRHHLDFERCRVSVFTDVTTVNKTYVRDSGYHVKSIYDKICILDLGYSEVMSQDIYTWPVAQHCVPLFDLYLNAVRYLRTISETSEYNSKNLLINERIYDIITNDEAVVFA